MAKLIVTFDEAVLFEVPIQKAVTTIGRKSSNDLVLDSLAVSGLHAEIRFEDGRFHLVDSGSTNGTSINGKTLKAAVLKSGDKIGFGRYELRFMLTEVDASPLGQDTIAGVVADGTSGQPTDLKRLIGKPSTARTPIKKEAHLALLNGPSAGKSLVLNKTLTTLGVPDVQVVVITRRDSGFYISHVKGAAVLTVNQTKVTQSTLLKAKDIIEFGGARFEFLED